MATYPEGVRIAVPKDTEQQPAGTTVRVLEADPDLAADLNPEDVATARDLAVAEVIAADPGSWSPPEGRGDLGFLVLEGALRRDVSLRVHRKITCLLVRWSERADGSCSSTRRGIRGA